MAEHGTLVVRLHTEKFHHSVLGVVLDLVAKRVRDGKVKPGTEVPLVHGGVTCGVLGWYQSGQQALGAYDKPKGEK